MKLATAPANSGGSASSCSTVSASPWVRRTFFPRSFLSSFIS